MTLNQAEKSSLVFAERLKALLKKHKMTQVELARRLGFAKSTVTGYVQGRVPPHETLGLIANIFDVTIDYLLGRDETAAKLDPRIRKLVDELPPGSEDVAVVVLKYARDGASAEELEDTIKKGMALKEAMRRLQQ